MALPRKSQLLVLFTYIQVFIGLSYGFPESQMTKGTIKLPPEIFPTDRNILEISTEPDSGAALPPLIFPGYENEKPSPLTNKSQLKLKTKLIEPPEIFPTDPSIREISTSKNDDKMPPLYFPVDINNNNETALKILQKLTDHKPKEINEEDNPKNDVENIQSKDDRKTPVELEEQYRTGSIRNDLNFDDDTIVDRPTLHHGHIMGIIVGVMAILCISAYAGLVMWKKYIERKYGMRERLVNEEDECPVSRTRHYDHF